MPDSTNAPLSTDIRQQPVLLVDDDPVVIHLLSSALTAAGYTVQTAKSAAQCLLLLQGGQAQGPLPQLILLDVQLADKPGPVLLQEIRQHSDWAAIPVALVSANSEREVRAQFPQLGPEYFLEKPFPPETVVELLRRI